MKLPKVWATRREDVEDAATVAHEGQHGINILTNGVSHGFAATKQMKEVHTTHNPMSIRA